MATPSPRLTWPFSKMACSQALSPENTPLFELESFTICCTAITLCCIPLMCFSREGFWITFPHRIYNVDLPFSCHELRSGRRCSLASPFLCWDPTLHFFCGLHFSPQAISESQGSASLHLFFSKILFSSVKIPKFEVWLDAVYSFTVCPELNQIL